MKRSAFKRFLCAAAAAAMLLQLTACGKRSEPPMASKENIFSSEEIALPENFDWIQSIISGGDRIFVMGSTSEHSGEGENFTYKSQTKLCILDMSGKEIKTVVIAEDSSDNPTGKSRNIGKTCVDSDGNIAMLVNEYSWNEETMESSEDFFILRYDREGNPLSEVNIDALKSDNGYSYISEMALDNSGNIFIVRENNIFALDSSGKLKFKIEGEKNTGGNSGSSINSLCRTTDGKIAAIINSYEFTDDNYKNTMSAKFIDVEQQKLTGDYPLNSRWYDFYTGGGDYDVCVSTGNSLVGVKIETGESETIIDWLKSGFDTNALQNTALLPDGRILCSSYSYQMSGTGYSYGANNMILTILTKVDPADIPDKQLITLSAFYLDYRVRQRIVDFNKNSDKYQIEVTAYSEYDDGTGDYSAGITKLNNDLIAGNIPDIILVNQSMPFDSYVSKGIIADLNKFISKDETINKDDYLENVLDSMSMNGKLYQISPSFSLRTLAAKKKYVGGEMGWTMEDYIKFAEENKDKETFSEITKSNFLYMMLSFCMDSYVNRETGECSFNKDGFKALLEAANAFPEEIDYDKLYADDTYWITQQTACREDRTLLSAEYIYSFSSMREIEQGKFGEDITFIGYPCDNGNGTVIAPDTLLAITAKAKNPDGAWEFVRYFLTDEYQSTIEGSFPIKLSAYGSLMEKAKEKPYYMDGDNKVEYDRTYWLGESEVKIGENTDADNQRMMDLIKSATTTAQYDEDLLKIVTEEAAAYFSGSKSAEDVADIIQNRANIYINENR